MVKLPVKISEEEALEVMFGEAGALAEQQKIVAKGERLIEITTTINKQLTMLLAIIQENERERESLRRELSRSQDQVRCLLSDAPWSSPLSRAALCLPALLKRKTACMTFLSLCQSSWLLLAMPCGHSLSSTALL